MTLFHTSRRSFLCSGVLAASIVATACATTDTKPSLDLTQTNNITHVSAETTYRPEPVQVPVTEGYVSVPGARLWYWDTGGPGEAVVLLHPATGNGAIWGYQQPVLAKAGYRVISYSRRGHYRSEVSKSDSLGTGAGDLALLLDHLDVEKVHVVGAALGGAVAVDFTLSYPDRVRTLTLASTLNGIDEKDFRETTRRILTPGFQDMPADFRELSPSYRAAHKEGTERWLELSYLNKGRVRQPKLNFISYEALESISVPILTFTGATDLYFPPSRLRNIVPHFNDPTVFIFEDTGHATHWEQPDAFNRLLLDHIGAKERN